MAVIPAELSRDTAAQWANLVATHAGQDAEAILQKLQQFRKQAPAAPAAPLNVPGKVGVWVKQAGEGKPCFVRQVESNNEWHWWADVQQIPPKSNRPRVVLLGESVARGYFYDPYLTVASALESCLNAIPGLHEAEVIDLARTDLHLEELTDLTTDAVQLEPEVLVIFAGNNWNGSLRRSLSHHDLRQLDTALEVSGFAGMREQLLEKYKVLVTAYTEHLGSISRQHGIPVVFIIPEFNLADWHSMHTEQSVSRIPGGGTGRWAEAGLKAERALAAGDVVAAEALAVLMIQIDESNPVGYELLAQCKIKQDLHGEARLYLEKARDTAIFARSTSSPRMVSVVRQTLLTELARQGMPVVDLPEVFGTYLSGRLPGRELFLDYCHLTLKGIDLAVRAAALPVGKLLAKRPLREEEIKTRLQVDNEVVALAHICAAVHNAHFGQPYEMQHYLCRQAVQLSKSAAKVMIYYADFASRRASTVICKSYGQFSKNLLGLRYSAGNGFLNRPDRKLMDVELVNAMVAALLETGIDLRNHLHAIRKQEHSVENGKINLLEPYYHHNSYEDFMGREPIYFQSRNVWSDFQLITGSARPVLLNLTYRVPNAELEAQEQVTLTVNGSHFVDLPATRQWTTCTLRVPGDSFISGVNTIRFEWPVGGCGESVTVESFYPQAEYLLDKMFQVTGEIHAFDAQLAEPV